MRRFAEGAAGAAGVVAVAFAPLVELPGAGEGAAEEGGDLGVAVGGFLLDVAAHFLGDGEGGGFGGRGGRTRRR